MVALKPHATDSQLQQVPSAAERFQQLSVAQIVGLLHTSDISNTRVTQQPPSPFLHAVIRIPSTHPQRKGFENSYKLYN